MNICNARPSQAAEIARLIMTAMNHECCRYFTGSNHSLAEFERVMTRLVTSADSQYSYRNTLTALDDDGKVAGICVTYDGADLHRLREAFVQAAKEAFGRDFSQMDDETAPGELYIDSLAVDSPYRGQGIATDEIAHVWERYYKSSTHHVRPTDGSGLGLSIVKEILAMHRADFDVESQLGKGSTFWFELPLEKTR